MSQVMCLGVIYKSVLSSRRWCVGEYFVGGSLIVLACMCRVKCRLGVYWGRPRESFPIPQLSISLTFLPSGICAEILIFKSFKEGSNITNILFTHGRFHSQVFVLLVAPTIMKDKVGLLMEGHHPRTNHPVHGNSVAPTFIVRIRSSFNLNVDNDIYHRARILIAMCNNILLM